MGLTQSGIETEAGCDSWACPAVQMPWNSVINQVECRISANVGFWPGIVFISTFTGGQADIALIAENTDESSKLPRQ